MHISPSLIGIGNPIVDTIALVEESFVAQIDGDKGGMELVDAPTITSLIASLPKAATVAPGGSAGNTLFALARMGASTSFLGKTGNCAEGDFYRESFSKLGGDASRFKIGKVPNGRCLSLVTPDGERTMRTDLGAAMTLAPKKYPFLISLAASMPTLKDTFSLTKPSCAACSNPLRRQAVPSASTSLASKWSMPPNQSYLSY